MKNYNRIVAGWFSEICPMWPGVALSLEIEDVLYTKKSKYQQIDLYQTKNFGKMLVLDGIIQLTEPDEFAYHEMMAHLPMFAHPCPEKVLVVGGGDGGVLREIARHECVKSIDFCEIDEEVIHVSKEFLPQIACGFDDSRVDVHIMDATEYVHAQEDKYDVIVVDSSDPIGPGEALFERPFYEDLKKALRKNGIIATQGESFFLHQECVKNLVKITRQLFDVQAYAYTLVPTYPGGHIGICLGSKGPKITEPARKIPGRVQQNLKYYCKDIHKAAFFLPYFTQKMFESL